MKLSWRQNRSYSGWVKCIGKQKNGKPQCFYLGACKDEAELKAIKLAVAYKRLRTMGWTGWTSPVVKAVLAQPIVAPEVLRLALGISEGGEACRPRVRAPVQALRLHDAVDDYLAYEDNRALGQTSLAHVYGVRTRVNRLKRMIPDRILSEIGYDELAEMVAYLASRPKSKHLGRRIGVVTAHDTIKVVRTIFDWLNLSGRWMGPANFQRVFRIRRRNLMTTEERAETRRGVEIFTIDDLRRIMASAPTRWHRVMIATAVNLAMTQNELATLRRCHIIGLDSDMPAIEKGREKTDVFCRWGFIFPEVAEGLRWVLSTHEHDLVFSGSAGEPLVVIDKAVRRDTVHHWWYKLVTKCGTRYLPFRFLRKTAADMLRKLSDRDTSEAFLSHANNGVSRLYTNHDWEKLAAAIRLLHAQLRPIFDVPDAPSLLPKMRKFRRVPSLAGKARYASDHADAVMLDRLQLLLPFGRSQRKAI